MSVQQELEERNKQDDHGRRAKKGSAATTTEGNTESGTVKKREFKWFKNEEIDAKIDAYAAAHPEAVEYHKNTVPMEYYVRRGLMEDMNKEQARNERIAKAENWMNAEPGRREAVMFRVRNVPEEERQDAIVRVAKSMAADDGFRAAGVRM